MTLITILIADTSSCSEVFSSSTVTVVSQNTTIGGILSMTCAQHHALVVGNLLRTCQIGGTWDGVEPLCEGFILKTITLFRD